MRHVSTGESLTGSSLSYFPARKNRADQEWACSAAHKPCRRRLHHVFFFVSWHGTIPGVDFEFRLAAGLLPSEHLLEAP
jgi:hypothetical protein